MHERVATWLVGLLVVELLIGLRLADHQLPHRAAKVVMSQGGGCMSDSVRFKDFNFKLAVIQRLMYEQSALVPRFDVYAFAKSYTARQIDIDDEGYDIIPKVRQYFEQHIVVNPTALTYVSAAVPRALWLDFWCR